MERSLRNSTLFCLGLVLMINWWSSLWSDQWSGMEHTAFVDQNPPGFSALSNLWPLERIIEDMQAQPAERQNSTETDTDLVLAARNGERGAFAGLYRRHAGWMQPLLWRLTGGDDSLAEELLQESFVQAWQKLEQLREPERFGGWLKQLAINLALADRRRLKVSGTDDALPHIADIEPPWPATDMDLERAVAKLPTRARDVLVLFCLEGYSHDEIARTLCVEIGTSKAQLHRARQLLKEALS
jgi:RNA polymerase sigma factor (sigma-70 family)